MQSLSLLYLNSYKNELCDFVEQRLEKINLNELLFLDYSQDSNLDLVMDHCCDIINADWIQYGTTKIVICFEEYPEYVFKIPVRGIVTNHGKEFFDGANINFSKRDLNAWDYCAAEEWVYKQACKNHVENFFAETKFLMDYWTGDFLHPVYISENYSNYTFEKMMCHEDEKTKRVKNSTSLIDTDIPPYILSYLLDVYSLNRIESLNCFLKKYKIEDLHEGNFGMKSYKNSITIKLIDYSDYND